MRGYSSYGRFGRSAHLMGLAAASVMLAACASQNTVSRVAAPHQVAAAPRAGEPPAQEHAKKKTHSAARRHGLRKSAGYSAVGLASWYGAGFDGRRTADGETFDKDSLTAAHPSLPLPCRVRVTNLANRRSLVVRVNDRGPYAGHRLIDVSARTAKLLGFYGRGLARVKVEYVGRAD